MQRMTEFRSSPSGLPDSLRAIVERETASRRAAAEANAWLASIVENTDDAILSKDLNGIITSWNRGATRLFGFEPEDAIGHHITIIIPRERWPEEDEIIARIRRGESVDHFETVRQRKDASFVDVALTISPVRTEGGEILGASKIARDISSAKRDAERQELLLREMNHRIKNLFAMVTGLISLSRRGADSADALADDLTTRVGALARAHDLILPDLRADALTAGTTTLRALLEAVVAPHRDVDDARVSIDGCDIAVGTRAVPSLALLFHEFATNAVKYGALARLNGRLTIDCAVSDEHLAIEWRETAGGVSIKQPSSEGFGSRLERATVRNLAGTVERAWRKDGLSIRLVVPLQRLVA